MGIHPGYQEINVISRVLKEALHRIGETTEGVLSGEQGFCGDWVSKDSATGFWEVSGTPTLALVLETLAFLVSQLVGAAWHLLDWAGFQFPGSSTPPSSPTTRVLLLPPYALMLHETLVGSL